MQQRFTILLGASRGFSLIELMVVVAFAGTLMAIALPILGDITQAAKLSEAVRGVERELQGARLRAVNSNRALRVRLNCPSAGFFRTVEVIGGGAAADVAANRCDLGPYPFPAADTDLMTRPNSDGPLRLLPLGATVTTTVFEFQPDGTTSIVVGGVAQAIAAPVTITITRSGKSKLVTINGAGKIQLQ